MRKAPDNGLQRTSRPVSFSKAAGRWPLKPRALDLPSLASPTDTEPLQPQLRITKCGDPLGRRLLVSAARYILGPFGPDCDLRRFGERLALRGGKNAKKRAAVAVARKLAVMMHGLWVNERTYDPHYLAKRRAACEQVANRPSINSASLMTAPCAWTPQRSTKSWQLRARDRTPTCTGAPTERPR